MVKKRRSRFAGGRSTRSSVVGNVFIEGPSLKQKIAERPLPLEEAKYKAFTAKRRTAAYGSSYDFETNVLGTANVVGGFVVTDRMLEMFKGKEGKEQQARKAERDGGA